MKNSSKSLKRECAEILEKMKQFKEAGELYIKGINQHTSFIKTLGKCSGEFWEKGAGSFLKAKLYNKVGEIIHRVDAVKIHQAYAKVD